MYLDDYVLSAGTFQNLVQLILILLSLTQYRKNITIEKCILLNSLKIKKEKIIRL
jgi:hypothetical protein